MKVVYVCTFFEDEQTEILGVFTSHDSAEEAAKVRMEAVEGDPWTDYEIEEHPISN